MGRGIWLVHTFRLDVSTHEVTSFVFLGLAHSFCGWSAQVNWYAMALAHEEDREGSGDLLREHIVKGVVRLLPPFAPGHPPKAVAVR